MFYTLYSLLGKAVVSTPRDFTVNKYLMWMWRDSRRAARRHPHGQKLRKGGRISKSRAINLGIK